MKKHLIIFSVVLLTVMGLKSQKNGHDQAYQHFLSLITSTDGDKHQIAFEFFKRNWKPTFNIIALELSYLSTQPKVSDKMMTLLQKNNRKFIGHDYNQWYEWLWNQDQKIASYYHELKGLMHRTIDPRFMKYFKDRQDNAQIRFDEIRWGGVLQDGIPPLRNPNMLKANQAYYLQDGNEVFGIAVNGDFRAYPKRILAWHEMFVDVVGGVPVAGVYCTLCGTVILYKTTLNSENHQLGTSGFLYRSNKLMYDQKTQSLWNTLQGKPVVGPLVGKGIELEYLSTVTTTWGEWKKQHPTTTVLDINTGHQRDYGEGVAYNAYFATDELMFNVPTTDRSLKNKQSILAIRVPDQSDESIAISVDFLKKKSVYHDKIANQPFVVFTDKTGANRVFATKGLRFVDYNPDTGLAIDQHGNSWNIEEEQMTNQKGGILKRLHSFNAFWFGWKAVYPETRLIK